MGVWLGTESRASELFIMHGLAVIWLATMFNGARRLVDVLLRALAVV